MRVTTTGIQWSINRPVRSAGTNTIKLTMKLNKHLFTVLTITGTFALGTFATAQEKKEATPAPPAAPGAPAATPNRPPAAPRDPTAGLIRYLNLSQEQAAKIKPILDQEVADMK